MNWNRLLDYLDDDYKVQESFFRQYYNAFKNTLIIENEKKGIKGSSIATRSNLVPIFEKLIERNPEDFLDKIIEAGQCYSLILHPPEDGKNSRLRKPLLDLERIQGTPSYLLLMYLIEKKKQFNLEVEHLFDIIQYLVRFFVRRNLTDFPATRELTKLFMDIIKDIDGLTDIAVVDKIKQKLAHSSTNDDVFRKHLEGPVYSENSGVVRFILCALAEKTMTQEKWKNLWAMDGKKYVWTIEHIFPQGTNIPPEWEEMIANGDKNKARKLQNEYVDLIGNLTLSGYNSALGSMSFQDKRDKKDKKTNEYIGYRNGLHLNEYLKDLPSWTDDNIKERTRLLVDETIELFKLT
jgi:hypothetical protein